MWCGNAMRDAMRWAAACLVLLGAGGCNSPYPDEDEGENILYTTFSTEPKFLEPARSYSTNESELLCQIVEPPLQYHLLRRPFELIPLTTTDVPVAEKMDVAFRGETVKATVYTVRLQKGIRYQDHPCFVARNRRLTDEDVQNVRSVWDVKPCATRELVADDYVHGIRRLADPRLDCPIFSTLAKSMLGLVEYQEVLEKDLARQRAARREAAGMFYNEEADERFRPVPLDHDRLGKGYPFVRRIDRHTFQVVLKQPYPQIRYWMAMAFFAPVPREAIEFFDQSPLIERNIRFDKNPVGTGPFVLREFDRTNQMVMEQNPNYRLERYPDLPEPDPNDAKAVAHYNAMRDAGMLDDANDPLPLVRRVVFRMEKEYIPRWSKFLQGYYDTSGISSDLFDQAVQLTSRGESELTEDLEALGIRLVTGQPVTIDYAAFNMADEVVGGLSEEKRKLRRAISIAYDAEEEIAVFRNGRGVSAHHPVPPGILSLGEGPEAINPYVYTWDAATRQPRRRSLDEARRLLAEAGYPGGRGPDGKRLQIRFATTSTGAGDKAWLHYATKQFRKLNIRLVCEVTDYNEFRDKVRAGNYQFLRWGWVPDYPDPENFLFLLHGPNGKKEYGGENVANYASEEYDTLFRRMEAMEPGPERTQIIRRMVAILQKDAPWIYRCHAIGYTLCHSWYHNAEPHGIAFNLTKYRRINAAERAVYRRVHNRPVVWPVVVFLAALTLLSIPAAWVGVRHFRNA